MNKRDVVNVPHLVLLDLGRARLSGLLGRHFYVVRKGAFKDSVFDELPEIRRDRWPDDGGDVVWTKS